MRALLASLALVVALSPVAALADVTPPEVQACFMSGEGKACTFSGWGVRSGETLSGTCQKTTCSRLDYSHWDGGMPGTTQVSCIACVEQDAGVPDSSVSPPTTDTGDNGGGCGAVSRPSTPKEIGALLFAGSFSLLFVLKRRRNRS